MLVHIHTLFEKIRSVCKECNQISMPTKIINEQISSQIFQEYLIALENIKIFIVELRSFQEQYSKLEVFLQKQQTQIRKYVGLQQQLKLYIDGLKLQLEESQNQKQQLLVNSKNLIRDLKRDNEKLYAEIKISKKENLYTQHYDKDHSKSRKKKTQLTQRIGQSNSEKKKKYGFQSKKKQFPNYTILSYMNSKKKKERTPIKTAKETLQKSKRKNLGGLKIHHVSVFKANEGSKSKKKVNKSVNSLSSLELNKSRRR